MLYSIVVLVLLYPACLGESPLRDAPAKPQGRVAIQDETRTDHRHIMKELRQIRMMAQQVLSSLTGGSQRPQGSAGMVKRRGNVKRRLSVKLTSHLPPPPGVSSKTAAKEHFKELGRKMAEPLERNSENAVQNGQGNEEQDTNIEADDKTNTKSEKAIFQNLFDMVIKRVSKKHLHKDSNALKDNSRERNKTDLKAESTANGEEHPVPHREKLESRSMKRHHERMKTGRGHRMANAKKTARRTRGRKVLLNPRQSKNPKKSTKTKVGESNENEVTVNIDADIANEVTMAKKKRHSFVISDAALKKGKVRNRHHRVVSMRPSSWSRSGSLRSKHIVKSRGLDQKGVASRGTKRLKPQVFTVKANRAFRMHGKHGNAGGLKLNVSV